MAKILYAIPLASIAMAGSVWAADMPLKAPQYQAPTFSWTGLYVGGHVGGLWGGTTIVDDGVVTDRNAPTNGVVGGVLAGAMWQTGALVLGAEGDFGWSNAHGVGIVGGGGSPPPPPPATTLISTPNLYDINSTSHIRGLLGYALGPWLFFAAGGAAFADFTFQEGESGTATTTTTRSGAIFSGGSIGGGIAYAFTDRITGRVEYLFDDFGHKTYLGGDGDPYRVGLTSQTLRGALTLKFW